MEIDGCEISTTRMNVFNSEETVDVFLWMLVIEEVVRTVVGGGGLVVMMQCANRDWRGMTTQVEDHQLS